MPNVAFDLGIVFLAVACVLLIALHANSFRAFTRGLPVKQLLGLGIAFALYTWWPEITAGAAQFLFDSSEPGKKAATAPAAASAAPTAPAPVVTKSAVRPAARSRITVIEDTPPERIVVQAPAALAVPGSDVGNPAPNPPQALPSAGSNPYDSKIKRGAKAIGHLFRIGKDSRP